MIRGMTVLWTLLALVVGVALFTLKHEVQSLEEELAHINKDIYENEESIHVLKAEWSYLNDPQRVGALADRLLGMKPIKPDQLSSIEELTGQGVTSLAQRKLPNRTREEEVASAKSKSTNANHGKTTQLASTHTGKKGSTDGVVARLTLPQASGGALHNMVSLPATLLNRGGQ